MWRMEPRYVCRAFQGGLKTLRGRRRVTNVRLICTVLPTRLCANFVMQEDTLMPAAPTVQPAKQESTVLLQVTVVRAALRVSTVKVERQMPRLAPTARLASIKKSRDNHRAYHVFQELSTINSEKVLVILAHLDFFPTRRSSINAARVSWACMRHNKVRRFVSYVFQVSTVTLPAQSTVRHVLLTRSPLKWVRRFAIHRRRIKLSAPVDPPSSLLPKDGT